MAITVDDYIKQLQFVQKNLLQEQDKVIDKHKQQILDLNREDQLYDRGINNEGTPLLGYRPYTIRLKQREGAIWDHTTLFHTGAFYGGFDLLNRNNVLSIYSRDSKSSDLQSKYGSAIFGLTPENEAIVNELIAKELELYLQKYL